MWKKITCPVGVTDHFALYNSIEKLFKCGICTKDKVITSFDAEVLIVEKFIKFEKANPFIFKQTEIGRVGLPTYTRNMNISVAIDQQDKDGNPKKARWHNIGKIFFYDDGTGTVVIDSIPINWNGRAKLFHPREYDKPQEKESSGPRETEGFGGE